MKKVFVTLATLAVMMSTAMADRWYLYELNENSTSLINLDTLRCKKGICNVWEGTVNTIRGKRYDLVMSHNRIDCGEYRALLSELIAYKNGKIVEEAEGPGKWRHAMPNTNGYAMIKATCESKSRDKDWIFDFPYLPEYVPVLQDIIKYVNEEERKRKGR